MTDAYNPKAPRGAGFAGVRADFSAGRDTPGDYLDRHLKIIYAREDTLRAFAALECSYLAMKWDAGFVGRAHVRF